MFSKFSPNFFYSDVQKTGHSKLGTKAGLQRAISQFAQEKKAEMMKTETGECLLLQCTSNSFLVEMQCIISCLFPLPMRNLTLQMLSLSSSARNSPCIFLACRNSRDSNFQGT